MSCFPFEEATVNTVHAAMASGELTCSALTDYYLRRIEAYDRQGPVLNAILAVNSRDRDGDGYRVCSLRCNGPASTWHPGHLQGQLRHLRDANHRRCGADRSRITAFETLSQDLSLQPFEFKVTLNRYLESLGPAAPVKSLEEFIASGGLYPPLRERYEQNQAIHDPLNDPEYRLRLLRHNDLRQGVMTSMADNQHELCHRSSIVIADVVYRAGNCSALRR